MYIFTNHFKKTLGKAGGPCEPLPDPVSSIPEVATLKFDIHHSSAFYYILLHVCSHKQHINIELLISKPYINSIKLYNIVWQIF